MQPRDFPKSKRQKVVYVVYARWLPAATPPDVMFELTATYGDRSERDSARVIQAGLDRYDDKQVPAYRHLLRRFARFMAILR